MKIKWEVYDTVNDTVYDAHTHRSRADDEIVRLNDEHGPFRFDVRPILVVEQDGFQFFVSRELVN